MSIASILVTFALVDNVVLSRLLGINPPSGFPGSLRRALVTGASTGVIICVASLGAWAADAVFLLPLGFAFLRTPVYVLLVAGAAWLLAEAVRRFAPGLRPDCSFPEAAINSAALGVVLIIRQGPSSAAEGLVAGVAAGAGYALVMVILGAIRQRLEVEQVPRAMRGLPLQLVSAGLLALAFFAFDRAFLARVLGG
jgi:electron transport complex protein RnfA